MPNKLTQPKVDQYISWLSRNDHFGMAGCVYDDKSKKLLDELFRLLEQIGPVSENGTRTLWLRAERGPMEDFGDAEELIREGDYESVEQFMESWKINYPDEVKWYQFSAVERKDEGYRAVILQHRFVIVQDKHREPAGFPNVISDFVRWIIDGAKECLRMLRDGTYNDFVQKNLPPQHRTGKICRKDFWDVWPDARADFFKDIPKEDVAEFIRIASAQPSDRRAFTKRLPSMTANDFFRCCAMGYAANNYQGGDRPPKKQYCLHADGRDEGLTDIDPDSPEAFHTWLHSRERRGGHPWEVCRGGNSTHVTLQAVQDEKGYLLYLDGDAWTRTIETVKFYLVLTRAGIPVYLNEAKVLADRLAETEMIGIVPEGVFPAYCENWFPDEHIIDFMNLPEEDREKFVPFCTWYDEDKISLVQEETKK